MELKFRVWDQCENRMVYLSGIFNNKSINFVSYTAPMQYTGIKDKNNKDIYEGDILYSCVKMVSIMHGTSTEEMKETTCVVEWLDKSCCFSNDKLFSMHSDIDSKYQEVIGNVYQNPELLTKKSTNDNNTSITKIR